MEGILEARKRLKSCRDEHERLFENELHMLHEAEKDLEIRLEKLNAKKQNIATINGEIEVSDDERIEINAGGKIIVARRATLTLLKGSRLEALFSGRWDKRLQRDSIGRIFLDANPICFQAIIDFLHEMAISPADHPADPPSVEKELEDILIRQLELFGIHDEALVCQSKIIQSLHTWELIHKWLAEEGCDGVIHLLHKSGRSTLQRDSSFRTKCANKGPTLTVVKDVVGNVVGGFIDISWDINACANGTPRIANKAFLFGLDGFADPIKLKPKSNTAYTHVDGGNWPCFGRSRDSSWRFDIEITGFSANIWIGQSYHQTCEGLFSGTENEIVIEELEIYQIVPQAGTNHRVRFVPEKAAAMTVFSSDNNNALLERWQAVFDARANIATLEEHFLDENKFIHDFAMGEVKDTINLSVSGTEMVTKRSTLTLCKDSVLARQFDDSIWKQQRLDMQTPVSKWTPEEVLTWLAGIEGVEEDVVSNFKDNRITGNELLALGKEGLEDLGVKRKGVLYLILKEIKKLEQLDESPVTFIEHSPYCFEKIVDYLRLKHAHSKGMISSEPVRPTVRESESGKFQKVVKYYFPGECSKFVLGGSRVA